MTAKTQRFFCRPRTQPFGERGLVYAEVFRPLLQELGLSVMSQPSQSTPVPALFVSRCPFTVAWCVWTIVIDALERQPWRAWPHIFNKTFKAVAPFWNHHNPAPAVILIVLGVLVKAAVFGGSPDAVFLHRASAVDGEPRRDLLDTKTATTTHLTASQVIARGVRFCTTVAAAMPRRAPIQVWRLMQDHKAVEALACQIDKRFSHNVYAEILIVSRKGVTF